MEDNNNQEINLFREYKKILTNYEKVGIGSSIFTIALILTNEFLLQDYSKIYKSINAIEIPLAGICFYLCGSSAARRLHIGEKEVKEAKKIYQNVIKNYNQLNKTFDFHNPIEIFTMYNYLLEEGYLSNKKEFEFEKSEFFDIWGAVGLDIINGKGLCRHAAMMLSDIFNDYGIYSHSLAVYCKVKENYIEEAEDGEYTTEDIMNMIHNNKIKINNNNDLQAFLEEIANNKEIKFNLVINDDKEESKIIRTIGNHSITFAKQDEKNYYLDPTLFRIYRSDKQNKKRLFDNHTELEIKKIPSILGQNKNLEFFRKFKYNNSTISEEEQDKLINTTLDICEKNTDIFETFYNDNKILYQEICNNLEKVKRKHK